jgi:predicted TIM-barrel fold metal-dependent hydrolase
MKPRSVKQKPFSLSIQGKKILLCSSNRNSVKSTAHSSRLHRATIGDITMVPPLITLEEHFLSQAFVDGASTNSFAEQLRHVPGLSEKLVDTSTLRLQSMDTTNISLQIISHAPTGSITPSQCQSANDQLAQAVRDNPSRFAGFAVLPVLDPQACATELARCVKEHGFVGALIDNHALSQDSSPIYYDGQEYLPFWRAAQDLDVPIYLHPTWASDAQLSLLYRGPQIPEPATRSISSSAFGWHSDVATHVLRLVAAGLFDKLPGLKLIIGHMGEMLPFMLERIYALSPRWGPLQRDFRTIWRENIWITTSGNWSIAPLACILRNTDVSHILYSVDYPFAKNEDGVKMMQDLEASGLVTAEQLKLIAHGNAEALLRVKHTKEFDS